MVRTRRGSPSVSGALALVLACGGVSAACLMLTGCASSSAHEAGRSAELIELAGMMTGSFSSAEQAAADPQFYDVRLHMVRIWPSRHDGVWLYVEQAMANEPKHPYRQRVYFVHEPEPGVFVSEVYTLEDPKKWIGKWEHPKKFSDLEPKDLLARDGCAITMRRESDGAFVGGTEGTACASDLRGASYATSHVRITAQGLETWDRGFDAAGAQVWGATSGPYRFLRIDAE